MNDFIKLLDKNLDYVNHEIVGDTCYIIVKSNRSTVNCPFCGESSSKVHSVYDRSFQDLPIQGKKVIIKIGNRKMFCTNLNCKHTTFAERFEFIVNKSKRTSRLEDEILKLSLNCSSIAASKILSQNTVNIGKSTICNLLKKRNPAH